MPQIGTTFLRNTIKLVIGLLLGNYADFAANKILLIIIFTATTTIISKGSTNPADYNNSSFFSPLSINVQGKGSSYEIRIPRVSSYP